MRLSPSEVTAIREEVARFDPAARVWLFGSRTDDRARGGDIDLLVRSDSIGFGDKVLLRVRLQDRIGPQQIDLVTASASRPAAEWIEAVAREGREL
jgi:predicted nucleotidyltransferase